MKIVTIIGSFTRLMGHIVAIGITLLAAVPDTCAQGRVGIGTAHPLAKLHVAGNVLIDTVRVVGSAQHLLTRDAAGVIAAITVDSLKKEFTAGAGSPPYVIDSEIVAQASTTSTVAQPRVSVMLQPGNYLVVAYAEVFNTGATAGVRMWLFEGAQEIAYGAPYSNTSTFGSWNAFRLVSITVPTTIILSYSSWPGGSTSYIRRARIAAVRIM